MWCIVTTSIFNILDIIKLHKPIFNMLNIIRLNIFIMPPYRVPFIAVFEYPMPFKLLVKGAWM